ncbi:hypothetical protein AVEN_146219-1 [Araneus ventricosus]|uniref:Uncharacterized protein n=1 Tax=Araneus ventricosus TaxID=182803 RepID=A0A4Y2CJ34_ARAVE|nr:hypothetical protein AVEN_146219-1 [Araneus ventricosus]
MFYTYPHKKKSKGFMSMWPRYWACSSNLTPEEFFHVKHFSLPNSSVAMLHLAGKCYWVASPLFEEMRKIKAYSGNCQSGQLLRKKKKMPYNSFVVLEQARDSP